MGNTQGSIGILFSVEGGGSISGASGALIRKQILQIISELEEDGAGVPIKFRASIDGKEIDKDVKEVVGDVQKTVKTATDKFKDIKPINSTTFTRSTSAIKSFNAELEHYVDLMGKMSNVSKKNRAQFKVGDNGKAWKGGITFDANSGKWSVTANGSPKDSIVRKSRGYDATSLIHEEQNLNTLRNHLLEYINYAKEAAEAHPKGKWDEAAESMEQYLKKAENEFQAAHYKDVNVVSLSKEEVEVIQKAAEAKEKEAEASKKAAAAKKAEADASVKNKRAVAEETVATEQNTNTESKNEETSTEAQKEEAVAVEKVAKARQKLFNLTRKYTIAFKELFDMVEASGVSDRDALAYDEKGMLYNWGINDSAFDKKVSDMNKLRMEIDSFAEGEKKDLISQDVTTEVGAKFGDTLRYVSINAGEASKMIENLDYNLGDFKMSLTKLGDMNIPSVFGDASIGFDAVAKIFGLRAISGENSGKSKYMGAASRLAKLRGKGGEADLGSAEYQKVLSDFYSFTQYGTNVASELRASGSGVKTKIADSIMRVINSGMSRAFKDKKGSAYLDEFLKSGGVSESLNSAASATEALAEAQVKASESGENLANTSEKVSDASSDAAENIKKQSKETDFQQKWEKEYGRIADESQTRDRRTERALSYFKKHADLVKQDTEEIKKQEELLDESSKKEEKRVNLKSKEVDFQKKWEEEYDRIADESQMSDKGTKISLAYWRKHTDAIDADIEAIKNWTQAEEESNTESEESSKQTDQWNIKFNRRKKIVDDYVASLRTLISESNRSGYLTRDEMGNWDIREAASDSEAQSASYRASESALGIFKERLALLEREKQSRNAAKLTEEQIEELQVKQNEALKQEALFMASRERSSEEAWSKLKARVYDLDREFGDKLSKSDKTREKYQKLMELVRSDNTKTYDQTLRLFRDVEDAANRNGLLKPNFWDKMTQSFGTKVRTMLSGAIIGALMKYVRQIYSVVKELDSALTQMQIVTGKTNDEMKGFADTMAKSAQKVGASISDLVNSATTFARLGYTMEEAGKFAELAAEYSKVANTDVNSATTSITTVVKAFGVQADELEGVLDKLMYIGEHYPVSAEELGTGFQNAGSALKAAGNTIDQSIALLTAANAQIQDISRASTGLRTIAARMTRSEADLEELGESIEDIVSTPKLQEFMRAFGVEILDAQGELRSTYDILVDLSKVWDDLSSTQRASIAEKLAGTRQQNVFFGLVDSMKTEAVGVMSTISEASGTLETANQTRLDSVQGRVDQLNASFQELSNTLLSSGLVKDFFNFANGVLQLLNSAGGFADGILVYIPMIIAGLTTVVGLLQKMNFIGGLKSMWGWLQKTAEGMRHLGYYTREANTAIDRQTLSTEELAAAQDRQAEAASTAKAGMAGWIAVIVAAIAVTATIVKKINEQIDANRQRVQEEAKAAKESADAAKAELEALEELQKELEKAKGDREALAAVYDKLSEKIDVNTRNIYSETDAYEAHLVALKAEIEYQRELTETRNDEAREAARRAIEEKRLERSVPGIFASILPESLISDSSAADMRALLRSSNTLTSKQKADIIKNFVAQQADTMMGTAGTADSGGFAAAWNANGPQNQGQNRIDYSDVLNAVDYRFINELKRLGEKNAREEYGITYEEVLGYLGYSAESYEKFFSELSTAVQDYLAKSVEKIVNQGNTGFGETFFNQIIDRLVTEDAATTKEIEDVLKLLTDNSSGVGQSLNDYYAIISDAANHTQAEVDEAYKSLIGNVEKLKWEVRTQSDEFWPVILEEVNKFVSSIEKVSVSIDYTSVELKSILDILNEVQPGFDAISTAMNDMAENGNLSASSLEGLMKIEGDLKEIGFDVNSVIERTAEGYKLADDALEKFIKSNITYYGTIGSNESKEGRENALQNLQKYRAVLLTLLREVEESDKKSGYNRRKDKLKDQLDEYKKLIDLRKKLLETYEDELKYQRELSQRQNALASLQAQLSLAELDQSAAGRARARELRAQVQDAQNDLDDFTLEHAIEVVTNNLDDQYSEYETFINDKLDRLEKAIKGVEDAVNNRIDADTLRELLGLIDEKINNIAPPGMNDYRYIALQNNGVAVKNAAEFDLDLDLRKRYKTWEKYINALYIRMMGNSKVAGLLGIEEHHSGGFVGGVKSNETFAKLMNGEFVVTPNQMGSFVNRTLPSIASGGNTFNSPLISIECDNVSQDALPGLRTIVNDAVEEIKRQFDGGMTRAANYSTNRKKLYI